VQAEDGQPRGLVRFHLQVSRPGLWFPTVWLYLLPLTSVDGPAGVGRLGDPTFWLGLFYVCWPLNHMVYGWNDLVDTETDAVNPRKGTWLFGARGTQAQLSTLPTGIAIVQLLCWPFLMWVGGPWVLGTALAIVGVLWAYNHPTHGLRGRPPGDLISQAGYLLTVVLSCQLNGVALPGPLVFVYLALFCLQAQLMGEVMDIAPDRATGRRTTATELGARRTKWLIITVVSAEVAIVGGPLGDPAFALGLSGFLAWLLLDQLVLFREGVYSLTLMKLFGIAGNLCAVFSMAWVWWRGGLG